MQKNIPLASQDTQSVSERYGILRPTGDRILVQPVEKREHEMVNGIHIPDAALEQNRMFYVIACGPKVTLVKPGERVISHTYTSGIIPIEDGTGRGFIKESECMAVI